MPLITLTCRVFFFAARVPRAVHGALSALLRRYMLRRLRAVYFTLPVSRCHTKHTLLAYAMPPYAWLQRKAMLMLHDMVNTRCRLMPID